MMIILFIVLIAPILSYLWVCIDSVFYPLYDCFDGAIIEVDEEDLKDYMDNSEYDWGHNIKNYMEEEL